MRITVFLLIVTVALAACAGSQTRSAFDKSFEKYNELVRWHDTDHAALFASPSVAREFAKRADEAKDARIFDYKIIDTQYDEKTLEASAVIVYSYYVYNSGEVKKLTDTQKWIYTGEGDTKTWKLTTPLPEFR